MSAVPLPDDVREMLARPNPAVISTLRPDGQPVSVATWYLLETPDSPDSPDSADSNRSRRADLILVNMDAGRRRLDYLRHDPRVSLTVLDESSWYTHVSVQGRVVELDDDPELREIDRLSSHYTGKPYPTRDRKRVSAWIQIERWHGWGAAAAGD